MDARYVRYCNVHSNQEVTISGRTRAATLFLPYNIYLGKNNQEELKRNNIIDDLPVFGQRRDAIIAMISIFSAQALWFVRQDENSSV